MEALADRLAGYLIGLARQHRKFPRNVARTAATVMGVSVNDALAAKGHLVCTKRLTRKGSVKRIHSIDGIAFVDGPIAADEVEQVKTVLRRHYPQVIDPRTMACPSKVARGQPSNLLVGDRIMPWTLAREIAGNLRG